MDPAVREADLAAGHRSRPPPPWMASYQERARGREGENEGEESPVAAFIAAARASGGGSGGGETGRGAGWGVAALEAGPPELPQGERRRRRFVFIV